MTNKLSFMRTIFILIMSLPMTAAWSQTTYLAEDFFVVGDTVLLSQSNGNFDPFDFSRTGVDTVWDFAALEASSQSVVRYQNPAGNAYQLPWCFLNGVIFSCPSAYADLTNLSRQLADTIEFNGIGTNDLTEHLHIDGGSAKISMLGITPNLGDISLPVPFEYEKPDTILHLPLSFGNIDTSTSRVVLDGSGAGLNIKLSLNSTRISEVDGYGQLVTPFGTFENVLRLKSTIFHLDTTFADTINTIPIVRTNVLYQWFDPAFPGPILSVNNLLLNDTLTTLNVSYLDHPRDLGTSTTRLKIREEVTLFPNPSSHDFTISTEGPEIRKVNIFNPLGNLIYYQKSFGQQVQIEHQFPPGIYYVHIENVLGRHKTLKLIKN